MGQWLYRVCDPPHKFRLSKSIPNVHVGAHVTPSPDTYSLAFSWWRNTMNKLIIESNTNLTSPNCYSCFLLYSSLCTRLILKWHGLESRIFKWKGCIRGLVYQWMTICVVAYYDLFIHSIVQYIILKDGILRFNSCNITSKRGVYFTVHSRGSIRSNCQWD